jgi:hypothetical protein
VVLLDGQVQGWTHVFMALQEKEPNPGTIPLATMVSVPGVPLLV